MSPLEIQRLLDDLLCAGRFEGMDDPHGIFLPPTRAGVRRMGLALEPWPELIAWVDDESLDLLFIHRPWRLTNVQHRELDARGVGVLAYHLAFDERLTTGLNPALAAMSGWGTPEVLGYKESRPLGMICSLPAARPFQVEAEQLRVQFGGLEEVVLPVQGPDASITRVVVVGAMNDALVRAAHTAGAGLYATGQWRPAAKNAVRETGIGVVAIGHHRSEIWGLRTLARLLREHADGLEMIIAPDL